jgi:hypothetical protein
LAVPKTEYRQCECYDLTGQREPRLFGDRREYASDALPGTKPHPDCTIQSDFNRAYKRKHLNHQQCNRVAYFGPCIRNGRRPNTAFGGADMEREYFDCVGV